MDEKVKLFRSLHGQEEPLLIGNVWNAQSAKVFEAHKFKAIATSSSAVAETLGYKDGEQMSFDEYVFVIRRIASVTNLPFSVDLEMGYGATADAIVENILALSKIGVVGINIEDTRISDGKRTIRDTQEFSSLMKSIVASLKAKGTPMFINVRCDAFLLGLADALGEATKRTDQYQQTGVDGLFFPFVTRLDDIRALTRTSKLPVNVMCMPELPDFKSLKESGVKRISMGNFVNKKVYHELDVSLSTVVNAQSFNSLF
jgi:PEP phosphonomutase and related enzymes